MRGEEVGVCGDRWFPDSRQPTVSRMFPSPAGLSHTGWRTALDGSQSEEILPHSEGRRRGAASDLRHRADASPFLFPRRPLDLRAAQPPEHLAFSFLGRSAPAGHSVPGIGSLPRRAQPFPRRTHPRRLSQQRQCLPLAADDREGPEPGGREPKPGLSPFRPDGMPPLRSGRLDLLFPEEGVDTGC
jgi:hypothetical protein